jgi:hypothetical protein
MVGGKRTTRPGKKKRGFSGLWLNLSSERWNNWMKDLIKKQHM